MTLPWIEKYNEAKLLGELATESLSAQDLVGAVSKLQTAVDIYKSLYESSLIPQAKKLIKQKLNYEEGRLKMLIKIARYRIKREIKAKPSPRKQTYGKRGPK
jgi:rubrerythrin